MRILLAPHGTRGDVQPIVALAVALRARGHVVQLVAPANFVSWVRGYGFDTESDGIDPQATLTSTSPFASVLEAWLANFCGRSKCRAGRMSAGARSNQAALRTLL